jgi:hypothetical protein
MKRFLLVLALVAVAGATYVATAPGSQTAGPTARQFKALKKEVAGLKKQVKSAQFDVNLLAAINFECMLHETVGVAQKGDPAATFGYAYTDSQSTPSFTTALDLSDTPTQTLLTLNPDPQLDCASLVGLSPSKRFDRIARLLGRH